MADLRKLIDMCIATKQGNKEFILSYDEPDWCAEIGNPVSAVRLGESSGEYATKSDTPEGAVAKLIELMRSGAPPSAIDPRDLDRFDGID